VPHVSRFGGAAIVKVTRRAAPAISYAVHVLVMICVFLSKHRGGLPQGNMQAMFPSVKLRLDQANYYGAEIYGEMVRLHRHPVANFYISSAVKSAIHGEPCGICV